MDYDDNDYCDGVGGRDRDVILSSHDARYEKIMFETYDTLGADRNPDREAEAARDAFRRFKSRMERSGDGKFLKKCGRARNSGTVVVSDEQALEKILADIRRRTDPRGKWYKQWQSRNNLAAVKDEEFEAETVGDGDYGNDSGERRIPAATVAEEARVDVNGQNDDAQQIENAPVNIMRMHSPADEDRGTDLLRNELEDNRNRDDERWRPNGTTATLAEESEESDANAAAAMKTSADDGREGDSNRRWRAAAVAEDDSRGFTHSLRDDETESCNLTAQNDTAEACVDEQSTAWERNGSASDASMKHGLADDHRGSVIRTEKAESDGKVTEEGVGDPRKEGDGTVQMEEAGRDKYASAKIYDEKSSGENSTVVSAQSAASSRSRTPNGSRSASENRLEAERHGVRPPSNGEGTVSASQEVDEKSSETNPASVSNQTTYGGRTVESSRSTTDDDQSSIPHRKQQLLPPRSCSAIPFNQALKTALDSYHASNTLLKSSNNPPPPKPPPFLSHQEECTLKTALAFVMAKARLSSNNENSRGKRPTAGDDDDSRVSNGREGDGTGRASSNGSGFFIAGRRRSRATAVASSKSARASVAGIGRNASSGNDNFLLVRPSKRSPSSGKMVGGKSSTLLGGLLSRPPPSRRGSVPSSLSGSDDDDGATDKKLKHVRDVLKLAVSAVLPLYRGALDGEECGTSSSRNDSNDAVPPLDGIGDDEDAATLLDQREGANSPAGEADDTVPLGRRPCAVYDFESAVQPSTVMNDGLPSSSQPKDGRDHHLRDRATLDGLCQHVIARLIALIREEELKRGRLRGVERTSATVSKKCLRSNGTGGGDAERSENNENRSNANGSPTVVTDASRQGSSKAPKKRGNRNADIVRDAIVKLICNDLIGDAYLYGSSRSSTSSNHHRASPRWNVPPGVARERQERIMAVCHVLHRLLFLDRGSFLGKEVVVAIGAIVSDLYQNRYIGRVNGFGELDSSSDHLSRDDGEPKSNSNQEREHSNQDNNPSKEKHQVVPSRWSVAPSHSSANISDRHERRLQSVEILSQQGRQRWCGKSNVIGQSHSGAKRVHGEWAANDWKNTQPPLPCTGDVLAVNLLRLLEGAAAIRLHHRQQAVVVPSYSSRSSTSQGDDREYMLDKVASVAATEVLTEIRLAVNPRELVSPLHVEDAASFYYNEKMCCVDRIGNRNSNACTLVLLGPGAKMMLRLHLFGLMNKLALYEQL